ncbi:MBOAT family O-acyltransferase [Leptospira sp. GIMC2001]|uniref:MBOAT family O-acyltransferase n=1 Tax=Leptospira sp. GIMC2001 TaxID=1513297 RepID=UPI00234AA357|nr:MBOAT family O-acyltransferase [Leptospira sp. GIMC2001]WCL48894.1 MBOAT family protein [Leptospira sp. GIMC2001]
MLFNSFHFFLFAPFVIYLYFKLPKTWQKGWLLVASVYFYAVFKVPFLLLLLFSIVITYYSTLYQVRANNILIKRILLWASIIGNLSILYFFKYIDFSFSAWNTILGLDSCDPGYLAKWGIILPMGISFFTLQAISYSVDVYRGIIPIHKNLSEFSLFISFFPQLVAGPILRAKDILPQFEGWKEFQKNNFFYGMRQLSWGFFKKTILADPVANAVDLIYGNPGSYDWTMMWFAVFLHAIQLYCDFSGYSDIAIGTARILGFRIPKNFNRPFFAINLSDLWARWHISLSSWLRDYVYISLGGNRVSEVRAYFNVFITFFLSGLWHGADWAVLAWGTFHSVLIVLERFVFSFKRIKNFMDRIPQYIIWIYPFFIFNFALFFFRAKPIEGKTGIEVALFMIERAFSFEQGETLNLSIPIWVCMAFLFTVDLFQEKKEDYFEKLLNHRALTYTLCALILVICLLIYSVTTSQPFVYFQF